MSAAINHAGRKRATKNGSVMQQSHKSYGAAVAVWLRYVPLFPAVERAKRKSAAWLTVFPERRLA